MESTIKIHIMLLIILSTFFLFDLFAQDTTYVVLKNTRRTTQPYLKSYKVINDTVYEKNNNERKDYNTLKTKILNKNYFVFIDKKGNRLMEGLWELEGFYGALIFYHKNGAIKIKGTLDPTGKCGDWHYFNRKGKLKRTKKHPTCDFF